MRKRTLIFLLVLTPIFVDQISGFLITELGFNFSFAQVIKVIYLLSFYVIIARSPYKFLYVLVLSLILFLPSLSALVSNKQEVSIFGDIVFFSKILLFPLTFFAFKVIFMKVPEYSEHSLSFTFQILFYILFLALLLSLFGFGLSSYGVASTGISFGYKGYFQAGNELSALYILLYSMNLHIAYWQKRTLRAIVLVSVLGLICAILLVTKTALIGFLLITILLPLFYKFYGKRRLLFVTRQELQFIKIFFILLVIGGPIFYTIFEDRIQLNIERAERDLNKARSLNSYIVSGRDAKVQQSLEYFSNYSIFEKILGTGWTSPIDNIEKIHAGGGSAEIDAIDLLVASGWLGLFFIYSFWLYILTIIARSFWKGKCQYSIPSLLVFLLLFSNSFIAGHILYSSMISFYFGLVVAMLENQSRDHSMNYLEKILPVSGAQSVKT